MTRNITRIKKRKFTTEKSKHELKEGGSKQMIHELSSLNEPSSEAEIEKTNGKAIFILDNALLKKSFVDRKRCKILDADEDANLLLKQDKNLDDHRPSIVYKALRKILDSPLNKAGMVGAVYVKIQQGLLFEIKPHVRIPRTLDRFCGIMLELLKKSSIRAKDTGEILIRVLQDPVTQHLPPKSHIIGVSHTCEKLVDIEDYVSSTADDLDLLFVVDTSVRGKINEEFFDDFISVSNYPLVARFSLGAICNALERKWNIL